MKIGSAFPSKYLKASDIPDGQFVPLTMDRVHVENVAGTDSPDDEKPVLYFVGKQKGMVLNKTNSSVISAAFGDETDEWHGKPIRIYSTDTTFQGKTVPCLRVKADRNGSPARGRPAPPPAQESPLSEEQQFDPADIPF